MEIWGVLFWLTHHRDRGLAGALARDTTARPEERREAEEFLAELPSAWSVRPAP